MKEPAEPAELIFTFNDLRRNRKRNWHGTGTELARNRLWIRSFKFRAVPPQFRKRFRYIHLILKGSSAGSAIRRPLVTSEGD